MKQNIKWFAAVLAVASGLAITGSAYAQAVTGTPYLSNVDPTYPPPSALYANWASSAIITSQPTGLDVESVGWGSSYYVIPGADVQYPLNPLDTMAVLTLTWNAPTAPLPGWVGVYFTLNDNFGNSGNLGGYGGAGNPGNPANWAWNGDVLTITSPLPAGQIAAIQAGTDAIYSFELGIDGSPLGATIYDVTFNSLQIVPEPASLALVGLGAAGLLIFRRRN